MRCKDVFKLVPLLFAILVFKLAADEAATGKPKPETSARAIVDTYKDVPKGVVLEGSASGFEALQSLAYDKDKNAFLINGKATYANPVSRKDFSRVLKAVRKDDRLGVTLVNGELRTYGDLSTEAQMAKELSETDRFLGGIIYGIDRLLGDQKLPGNYKPQKAENRTVAVVAFTSFTDYAFEKKGNEYKRAGLNLSVMLIPLSDKKTASGGHLPDEPKLKTYQMEKADKANIDHLKSHQDEYIRMLELNKTVAWGEAAAFARFVRDSAKIDSEEFLKQLK
ncbi:MAG: hypothetical protein HY291_07395 [Planctomycetes bacterium]|nr:hypothetical protein [Planctomycetota bacterium]